MKLISISPTIDSEYDNVLYEIIDVDKDEMKREIMYYADRLTRTFFCDSTFYGDLNEIQGDLLIHCTECNCKNDYDKMFKHKEQLPISIINLVLSKYNMKIVE